MLIMKTIMLAAATATLLLLSSCKKENNTPSHAPGIKAGDQITYEASATQAQEMLTVVFLNENSDYVTQENQALTGWSYSFTAKKDGQVLSLIAGAGLSSKNSGKISVNGKVVKSATSDFQIALTYH